MKNILGGSAISLTSLTREQQQSPSEISQIEFGENNVYADLKRHKFKLVGTSMKISNMIGK